MIKFDFTNITSASLSTAGLSPEDFNAVDVSMLNKFFNQGTEAGLGFFELPDQDISDIEAVSKKAAEFSNFILLGIGGSALGPRSILEALSPFHNYFKKPGFFIYDNVDPLTLQKILNAADLKDSIVNVITKSGSTAETLASFMIIWRKLKELGLKPQDHLVITTDPEKGSLREIAKEHNIMSLEVPPLVGGRFSVLSPVGLLLAGTAGFDIKALLRGAEQMHTVCMQGDLYKNPAYLFAAALFLMKQKFNRSTTVLVPYADRLKSLSEWFCQLWGESLGKKGTGLSPYPSTGTTDQHSQLQLWMEGPNDKVVVFIAVDDYGTDMKIPDDFAGKDNLGYLAGHSLSELIKTEQEATEIALTKNGRPSITIHMPKVDELHMGQLMHFFESATAAAGSLFGINPFDQPGVEEGKNLTYGIMGRKGFEERAAEFSAYRKRSRLII
ncbi:MAG: glucose-6-phosphate isomerase [Dissulfurispiraceae bacterium]|jgi:glucose-6-phosphate isomerase|nr:glucose-6-phosphate isomerase [Dissulfurispiraceae bacterium]